MLGRVVLALGLVLAACAQAPRIAPQLAAPARAARLAILLLDPTSGPPGSTVSASARILGQDALGLQSTISFDDGTVLATTTWVQCTGSSYEGFGEVCTGQPLTFMIPQNATIGEHAVFLDLQGQQQHLERVPFTVTPAPTATLTGTPTETGTDTPSATASATASPTGTPTLTTTPTSTGTATPTSTGTAFAPSATPTATATASATATPQAPATWTTTATATPTASPQPSATFTATPVETAPTIRVGQLQRVQGGCAPLSGPAGALRPKVIVRVLDAAGKPLRGATVSYIPPGAVDATGIHPQGICGRVSAPDGSAVFSRVPVGVGQVIASLGNRVIASAGPRTFPGETIHVNLRV